MQGSSQAAPGATGHGAQQSPGTDEVIEAAVTASRALVGLAASSLADTDEDVTLPQYRMLVVLGTRGPQQVTALAAALGVAAPTATRMCDRLTKKGLVKRRVNRRDRRQVLLSLTPQGRELLDAVTEHRRVRIASLLAVIPPHSHPALVEAFHLFAKAAGELADADWAAGWDL